MYSHDITVEQIRERQQFFHQQGRIDRQARLIRKAARHERRLARAAVGPRPTGQSRWFGAFRLRLDAATRTVTR